MAFSNSNSLGSPRLDVLIAASADSGCESQSADKETVVILTPQATAAALLDAADIQYDPIGHVQWEKLVVVVVGGGDAV